MAVSFAREDHAKVCANFLARTRKPVNKLTDIILTETVIKLIIIVKRWKVTPLSDESCEENESAEIVGAGAARSPLHSRTMGFSMQIGWKNTEQTKAEVFILNGREFNGFNFLFEASLPFLFCLLMGPSIVGCQGLIQLEGLGPAKIKALFAEVTPEVKNKERLVDKVNTLNLSHFAWLYLVYVVAKYPITMKSCQICIR